MATQTQASLGFEPVPVPVRRDDDGNYCIRDTRIPFERVIECYQAGDAPAEIIDGYPDLTLADVFAVLAYYFSHQADVDAYMKQQEEEAETRRREIEANRAPPFKAWLEALAQRQRNEEGHASASSGQ